MLSRVCHMTILSEVIGVMNVRDPSCQSSVASLSYFVTALASLLTDHNKAGLPIRAKYKHFKSICEHTCDNSPTDSSSSCLTR